MAFILVTCEGCGAEPRIPSGGISTRTCRQTEESEYRFRCPQCKMTQIKPADQEIMDILNAVGVKNEVWDYPRVEQLDGEPIDVNEVIEFYLGLEQIDDVLAELEGH